MNSAPTHLSENPFPGLRPFRADEEYLFFGRESQVDLMVDKVARRRFLAVVGTSGSGKSSLVNCGLRPALHRGLMADAGIRWRMVQFRPGNNPLVAMASALSEDDAVRARFDFDLPSLQGLVESSLRMSKRGLSEVYQRAQFPEGTNLLIIVDQFEELFRYREVGSVASEDVKRRTDEATAFVNLLLDAKSQTKFPIFVVLTMRSDFLGDCAEYAGLPEAINDSQYLVPRLTRDERRAAIAGPVGVGGATISPLLLTRLVNDVGDNPDQLSILQHAMNRTWANWQHEGGHKGQLDLCHYEAIGTMARALDQHAERAYAELTNDRQRRICEKIFKAITDKSTDPRGIRRPEKLSALCQLASATPEEVAAVTAVFRKPSRSFLMPPVSDSLEPETIMDISHESLMRVWERLRQWTDEEVQSAQLYRRLAETAAWHAAGKAALWDDPDLQFALDWKEKEQPTEYWAALYGGSFTQAMSFLDASRQQRDKRLQEGEELRQRELIQVQALASERQIRIEQQAQAAYRLRRWLVALAGVATLLLVATGGTIWEARVARQKTQEARHAEHVARHAKDDAENQQHIAEAQQHIAEAKAREAENANRAMRLGALRVRDANLASMSNYADMAANLARASSPQEAAMWNSRQGQALLEMGDYADGEKALSAAIAVVPDDLSTRTNRGYLYLLMKQPAKARDDFQYVRDHIDNRSALNYLNLAIAQAGLADFPGADTSVRRAIKNVRSGDYDGGGESAVPPDLTEATGRTTLSADRAVFEVALYYMLANLAAYAGDVVGFQSKLKEADDKARSLPELKRNEAILIAITWAWLHMDVRCPNSGAPCKDYGALVSQAALWERVGDGDDKPYKPWASCYYQRFQRQHARWHLASQAPLAGLVETNTSLLADVKPVSSCFAPPPTRDALTLETEARENIARKQFQEAARLYDNAYKVADEPDRMRLLLGKAEVLYLTGRAAAEKRQRSQSDAVFRELRDLCDSIVRTNPREARVYYWHAIALDWLDEDANRKYILADVHKALAINPADIGSLSLLDELTPDSDPHPGADVKYLNEHLDELRRYYRVSPYTSKAFLHQAKLAREAKEYKHAYDLIEIAIAMQPDEMSYYEVRKQIELDAGIPSTEVEQELFLGHVQAYFFMKRRGDGDAKLATVNKMINDEMALNRGK